MKAYRVQRASGGGHAANVREELYVPELGKAFCAVSDMSGPEYFEVVTHERMSSEMRDDLIGVSQGRPPQRKGYGVNPRGVVDLSSDELVLLEQQIGQSKPSRQTPKELSERIFATVVGN